MKKEELKTLLKYGEITKKQFDKAQKIAFVINTEDIGLFIQQIVQHLDLADIARVTYVQHEINGYDGGYNVETKNGNVEIFGWVDFQYGLHAIDSKTRK